MLDEDPAGGGAVRAADARSATFPALYDATVGPLGSYAYRLVGDREAATAIVQEAYTRLLSRVVAVRRPRPYLFHVVTTLALDTWAGRATRPVPDAVEALPRRLREVVLLHHYAALPLRDVAGVILRPARVAERRAGAARRRLAELRWDAP